MLLGEMFTVNSLLMIFDCSQGARQGDSCSQRVAQWPTLIFVFCLFLAIFVGSDHVNRKCHACVSLRLSRDKYCPVEVNNTIGLHQRRDRKILEGFQPYVTLEFYSYIDYDEAEV